MKKHLYNQDVIYGQGIFNDGEILKGVTIIEGEKIEDSRGVLAQYGRIKQDSAGTVVHIEGNLWRKV